jgi:hypothetical protein
MGEGASRDTRRRLTIDQAADQLGITKKYAQFRNTTRVESISLLASTIKYTPYWDMLRRSWPKSSISSGSRLAPRNASMGVRSTVC